MTKKVNFKYKQVGRNLNVQIDGESFTVVGDKEKLAPIKEQCKVCVEKPTAKNFSSLKKLLQPDTVKKEKEKEEKKAEIKKVKAKAKTIKKTVKEETTESLAKRIKEGKMSEEELKEIEKAIRQARSFQPQVAPTRRTGEY